VTCAASGDRGSRQPVGRSERAAARPPHTELVAAVLVVLVVAALGATAALDRPARVVTVTTTIETPKPEILAVLTDFDAYDEWNPVITSASAEASLGSSLGLEPTLQGHDPEKLDAEVLVVNADHRLRPDVRDWEYEFLLQPIEPGRIEGSGCCEPRGSFAPFVDNEAAREALALIGKVLSTRLATGTRNG
jgi:hypothetical protein